MGFVYWFFALGFPVLQYRVFAWDLVVWVIEVFYLLNNCSYNSLSLLFHFLSFFVAISTSFPLIVLCFVYLGNIKCCHIFLFLSSMSLSLIYRWLIRFSDFFWLCWLWYLFFLLLCVFWFYRFISLVRNLNWILLYMNNVISIFHILRNWSILNILGGQFHLLSSNI